MLDWLKDMFVGGDTSAAEYQQARQLYKKVVAQARQPVFYQDLKVADTVPGRFEMVSLHMFILLDRLTNKDEAANKLAQQLVDVMFQDMDDVARETGVGDMGVGPRIKKLARSFQSRLEYYKETIEGEERGTLTEAIVEVFYKDDKARMPPQAEQMAEQLANYVMQQQSRLAGLSLTLMIEAEQLFANFNRSSAKG